MPFSSCPLLSFFLASLDVFKGANKALKTWIMERKREQALSVISMNCDSSFLTHPEHTKEANQWGAG